MRSGTPTTSGRVAGWATTVVGLALLAACGSAALHAWTLDGTARESRAWVEAARAARVREALLDVSLQWLRPRACGDQPGALGPLCKRQVQPILERELSAEWFERLLRGALAALLAFVDDGRDRTLADFSEARKRVRQELWALWRKADGWDAQRPEAAPFLPDAGPREYQDRIASATAGVPDRVTLGWLAVARRTPAGARNRIGEDVPPDTAARSPEGRALRTGWSWLQRLKWGLPAAWLVLGGLLVWRIRGLRWRLFAVGVALAAGGALHLGTLPVLRGAARDGLDVALPVGESPARPTIPPGLDPAGSAAREALIARGESQATNSVITALHDVGVRLADETLAAGRLPALVALAAGGVLLLAPLAAARPWRRRSRRRPADSLPPVIEPPLDVPQAKGACRMQGVTGPLLLLAVAASLAGCSSDRARRRDAGAATCPAAALGLHERTQLVQNTLTVAGFGQAGPVSNARLAEHESIELPVAVRPGYRYLLFAIGDSSLADVAAEMLDADGAVLGRDAGYGPVAAIDYLAGAEATLRLRLRAAAGSGDVAFLAWSRAGLEASGIAGGGGGGASCGLPIDLQPGGTVQGSTLGAFGTLTPTCASGGAPEHVYRLTLPARSVLYAEVEADFDVVLSLLSACTDDPLATIRCHDTVDNSVIEEALPPGTYFLSVDGAGREAGSYRLTTRVREAPAPGQACVGLPLLVPGEVASGTTVGRWNDFETDSSCAGGSPAPDAAWRLELDRPARVRLELEADFDAALALRADCATPASLLGCNDDTGGDTRRSRLGLRLAAGSYTVVVDGVSSSERGEYRLSTLVVPEDEPAPPGVAPHDRCESAAPMLEGEVLEADTLFAADDGSGSCAAAPGGADIVARLELDRPTVVEAHVLDAPDPAPTLYLWRACGGPEAACGIGAVTAELPAGPAWLVVDAPALGEDSLYRVAWDGWDPEQAARLCAEAPALLAGRPQRGAATGEGFLKGSCGNTAEGPETAYRLTMTEPGHVSLALRADFDCVLYVRAACPGSAAELGCNDDDTSANVSRLELDLAAGDYWVFVDSFAGNEQGGYELEATVTP